MVFLKRVLLFGLVNILVILTSTIVTALFGLQPWLSALGFPIFCLAWGMGGALISLWFSRIMVKSYMKLQIIDPESAEGSERYLLDRVHDIAREGGLDVMPEVGFYKSQELNAFATGPTRNRSLVAVSTGLVKHMDKEELDGVLAHEVSHITNGDMVTMTLIQGVINAFVIMFARVFAGMFTGRDDGSARPNFLYYTIVGVLEVAFGFLGNIVTAYFSRQREFRADAGSAALVGSDRMIRALETLGGNRELPESRNQKALETLKISGRRGRLAALFATHPPLDARIRRLRDV